MGKNLMCLFLIPEEINGVQMKAFPTGLVKSQSGAKSLMSTFEVPADKAFGLLGPLEMSYVMLFKISII